MAATAAAAKRTYVFRTGCFSSLRNTMLFQAVSLFLFLHAPLRSSFWESRTKESNYSLCCGSALTHCINSRYSLSDILLSMYLRINSLLRNASCIALSSCIYHKDTQE